MARPRRFRRYPEYKDSGVEWLGEVPEHWVTWKATHGFRRIGSGTTPKSDNPEYYDGDISWVTTSELRETVIVDTTKKVTTTAMREYPTLRMYPKGTLLFAMYGATIGRLGILGIAATVNQACAALAEPLHLATWFVYYWLQMRRPILIVLSAGGGQPNLSQDDLRQLRIPAPPLDEQRVIAAFLDRETAKIDGLVERKERLIELLQEKRTSLITRAVTRGLDPNAPTKNSGVEWLGEIPAHWEVVPFKRTIDYIEGPGIMAADFRTEEVPLLRISGIGRRWATLDGCNYLSAEAVRIRWSHFQVRSGDLLISGSASMGFCTEIDEGTAGAIPYTGIIIIRPRAERMSKNFVRWILLSDVFATQVDLARSGSTIQHFGPSHLGRMRVVAPPLHEQLAIADYLDIETSRFDALISKIRQAIHHLKEFRTALISAAVTGKIDVREAAS